MSRAPAVEAPVAGEPHDHDDRQLTGESIPSPVPLSLVAACCSALLGVFEITNTSIGWHLASGRWMLEHRAVLRADPFSFTAAGTPWIDHEWLFQVLVAVVDGVAGPAGLVLLRAAVAAALAVVLMTIGRSLGLGPPPALLLAVLCVWGARPRFFVRPELATLLLLPLVLWLVLERPWSLTRRLLLLGLLLAFGANLHGGILVAGPLIAGIVVAQLVASWRRGALTRSTLLDAATTCAVAVAAPVANPFGWWLWAAPFRLAHLVGQPHIPNPEWRLSLPAELPELYVALALAALVMVWGERRPDRWLLLGMAAALAIRHVRNLGLLFVLLPLVAAPALAALARAADRRGFLRRLLVSGWLAVFAAGFVALSGAVRPWPPWGFGYAEGWYPVAAIDVLEREGLDDLGLYNDVRFGGYLIDRRFPDHRVFLDDRNEIHEHLLAEIFRILGSSDRRGWEAMLERYGLDAALVRYHAPIREMDPSGRVLGRRGFSALWFPPRHWALVHFDDVAMLLVRRDAVDPGLLRRLEYPLLRPDDLEHLEGLLSREPSLAPAVAAEAARALRESPESWRARRAAAIVAAASPAETP